jgi:hypothetical protein
VTNSSKPWGESGADLMRSRIRPYREALYHGKLDLNAFCRLHAGRIRLRRPEDLQSAKGARKQVRVRRGPAPLERAT